MNIYVEMTQEQYEKFLKINSLMEGVIRKNKELEARELVVDINFNFAKRIVKFNGTEDQFIENIRCQPFEITGDSADLLISKIREQMKSETMVVQEFQRLNNIVDKLPNWLVRILSR